MTNRCDPPPTTLDDRYGRARRSSTSLTRAAWVAGILGAAVLAMLLWGTVRPSVHSEVINFDASDPAVTTMTLQVSKPADRSAQCTLEALNTGFAQVGVHTIDLGPSDGKTIRVEAEILTSEPATTAIVGECVFTD